MVRTAKRDHKPYGCRTGPDVPGRFFLHFYAVLTSLGGIVGVISGIGLAQLISAMMDIPVAIDVTAIVISVVFSTLIGVVFGLLPATQAANLNPIEALRRN